MTQNDLPCLSSDFKGIIDIIFVIGVNPMSQSSQSMLYNPMLMMCQNVQGSGGVGGGYPGGFPLYNQYLHHYCYMDPEEVCRIIPLHPIPFASILFRYDL